MAAHRKHPPQGAAPEIRRLAAEGFGLLGIAAHFNVSRDCLKRWLDEDAELNEAYELGKETERQALHALVVASAKANKGANVNAFFLLKTRHGYVETDNRAKVSVVVAVSSVLVVKDHGTDEEWAAKCASQQRALTADCTSPIQIEAPRTPLVDAVAVPERPVYVAAVPESQAAPVAAAPSYGPPGFAWQPQAVPVPANAPEPISGDPAMLPALRSEAPVWRGRA
ncbi:MAG TPA: hypothetical protein VGR47_22375 [Terracidiphilus sp.]|nr:hypothetical protein [Terracidiphilus sp.]